MSRFAKLVLAGLAALLLPQVVQAATYTATLSGPNESPPNASAGTGVTVVSLDTVTHTLQVSVSFSGLTGNTTASHIHCCIAPNGTAGVATATPTFPGFPLGVTSGSYNATFDTTLASTWNAAYITANGGTPASAEAALAAGLAAGQAYLNVHSSVFGGGEIRGFLALQQTTSATIPTLSPWTLALVAGTLGFIALVTLRRRQ
jgi:hypothetical protein